MLKLTHFQIISLFTLYFVSSFIAFLVAMFINKGHFSTPVGSIVGGFACIPLLYPAYKLTVKRPTQFLSQYGHKIVGKIPHQFFMYFTVIGLLALAASNLRELSDFLILVYLQGTPDWAIVGFFGICIIYAIRSGIGTVFRAAQGIFILSIGLFLIFPLLVRGAVDFNMLPALYTHLKLKAVSGSAFNIATLFGAFSNLFLVIPYIQTPKKLFRPLLVTVIVSLVIIMAHLIPILLIFGPDLAGNMTFPDLELIRSMRAGTFIETLDPLLMIMWLISLFVKVSFILHIAVLVLTHITGMTDYRPLCIPATAFCCILSLYFARSQPEMNQFMMGIVPIMLFTDEFIVPAFYWIIDIIRHGRGPKPSTTTD